MGDEARDIGHSRVPAPPAGITAQRPSTSPVRSVGMEDITPHYVTTLRDWRVRFEEQAPELERRGYDERFRRMWRLYLAYCEGGFAERRIGDVQLLLAKPGFRAEPVAPLLPQVSPAAPAAAAA